MWAELSILTKNNLPSDIDSKLDMRMKREVEKRSALDATYFRGQYGNEDQIIFWHMSNTMVFLVSMPESQTIKIHIENTIANSNLQLLKISINEVAERFIRFLKENGNDTAEMKAQINVDNDLFLRGTRMNFISSILNILRDHLSIEVFIVIATFLISLIRGFNIEQAGINVLIVFVVLVLWIIIAYLLSNDRFIYSEE